MKSLGDSTKIDSKDVGRLPIIPGTYPAHVSGFADNAYNDSLVFNLSYVIAPEASNVKVKRQVVENGELVTVTDSTGQPELISAGYLSGKEFRGNGVWLTPSPVEGESWKNKKYKQTFENMGVVFEIDDDAKTILGQVEEDDVIGLPCLVKIDREAYEKDGETKHAWKVQQVYPWREGTRVSADEFSGDVPF